MNLSKSRPFDFLHDSATQYSNNKTYDYLFKKALILTGEKKIVPTYKSFFSDTERFSANTFVWSKTPLLINNTTEIHETRNYHYDISNLSLRITRPISKTGKFHVQNALDYFENHRLLNNNVSDDVCVNELTKLNIYEKQQYMSGKGTQTMYRDSEIQTNPLISYALQVNYLNDDVLQLTNIKQGKIIPIRLEDNDVLEQIRVKNSLEKHLMTLYEHGEDVDSQIRFTIKLENCKSYINNKKFGHIRELQLQQIIKKMNDYITLYQNNSLQRVGQQMKLQEQNKNKKISKLDYQKNREMRKLQNLRTNSKVDSVISSSLNQRKFHDKKNATENEFYAPKFIAKNCPCKWLRINSRYLAKVNEQLITREK